MEKYGNLFCGVRRSLTNFKFEFAHRKKCMFSVGNCPVYCGFQAKLLPFFRDLMISWFLKQETCKKRRQENENN